MWIVASGRFTYGDSKHTQETFLRYEPETVTTFAMGPRAYNLRLEYVYPDWQASWIPPALFSWVWPASMMEVDLELIIRKTGAQDLRLGRTALTPRCLNTPESYGAFVCATMDGGSTTFWELDPASEGFEPIASVPGFYHGDDVHASGQVVVQPWMERPYLVDLKNRRVVTPLVEELEAIDWGTLAWRDDVVVRTQANYETGKSTITVYTIANAER